MRKQLNDSDEYIQQTAFSTSCSPKSWKYTIRLFGTIDDTQQLIPVLEALEDAGEEDEVEMHLQSLGGSLYAADCLIQAMEECKGQITTRATGCCASAASLILLNSPQFTLSKNFSCMIHCGSLGVHGTLSEVKQGSAFDPKHMEGILRREYEGFLTSDELDRMIDGRDYYMDGDEFIRRWNVMQSALVEDSEE